jgi:molybdopterin converting factor small subunit
MKVKIKCFATLSKDDVCDYHDATTYELASGATVADLAKKVEVDAEEVKIIFVNNKQATMDHVLSDGDQVALAPKSGGM